MVSPQEACEIVARMYDKNYYALVLTEPHPQGVKVTLIAKDGTVSEEVWPCVGMDSVATEY